VIGGGTVWRALGWPAVAALAIGLGALASALVWKPRLERELDAQTSATLDTRDRALRLVQERGTVVAPEPSDERFRAAFPDPDARGQRVAALLALAAKNGVVSRRSDYRVTVERDLGLAVYRINLPATGRYASLRGFVEAALHDDAALALDVIRMRRAQPGAAEVQAELQFGLWMNAGGDFVQTAAGSKP